MRTNYPEAWAYLKAKRAQHPREDAIEEDTEWNLFGQTPKEQQAAATKELSEKAQTLEITKKPEETHEQYIKRRTDYLMHKNLACRRGAGGKWFTIGGGGDGGCAFQVS